MAKSKLSDADALQLFDTATRQLQEDREVLDEIYEDLKSKIGEHASLYVDLGEVLTKVVDLKIKQTGQVVEVYKTVSKSLPKEEGDLSDKDLEFINDRIGDDVSGE